MMNLYRGVSIPSYLEYLVQEHQTFYYLLDIVASSMEHSVENHFQLHNVNRHQLGHHHQNSHQY